MLPSLRLGEINSGIHMYQFAFEPLHFFFGCGCGLGFEQKFWRIDGFGEKRHGWANLQTLLNPLLMFRALALRRSEDEGLAEYNCCICSMDEGRTLETSSSESLYGGQSRPIHSINQLIKPNYFGGRPTYYSTSSLRKVPQSDTRQCW